MSNISEKDEAIKVAQVEGKIRELEQVSRIVGNTLSVLAEIDIKGSQMARAITEIEDYNLGFKKQIDLQIGSFKSMLPKPAVIPETKAVDIPDISPLAEV